MLIDHIGLFFFPENLYLRAIGRLSAPVWFFFVGMHFDKGNNKQLFFYAIALLAALSLIKQKLDFDNVLISILLVKLLLQFAHKRNISANIHYMAILWTGFAFLFVTMPFIEYGSVGFLFAYCGYLHNIGYNPRKTAIFFAGTVAIYLYSQQYTLHYPSTTMLLTGLALLALMALLYRFKFRTYQISGTGANCVKFFSRYSLEIYFLHFIVFTAIKQWSNI